jgi:hypothetical protein
LLDPGGPLDAALRQIASAAQRMRDLPWPASLALAGAGLVSLAAGARARRPLAVAGGAAAGWAAGAAIAPWLLREVGVGPLATRIALASALAILSALFPPAFLFAAGALPGALAGWALTSEAVGTWTGIAAGGLAGMLFARPIAAMAAGTLGAVLLGAGLLGASARLAWLQEVSERPIVAATLAAVVAVAGAAFQWSRAWEPPLPPPEQATLEPAADQAETRQL